METTLDTTITPAPEGWSTRRKALVFGGAALAGMVLTSRKSSAQSTTINDADIFNFALNLEFLEAQFYSLAFTGGLFGGNTASGTGAAGGSVVYPPSPMVDFSDYATDATLNDFVNELNITETAHVAYLQSQLGTSSIAMPNLDFLNSFNQIGAAIGLGSFNAFANPVNFLLAAGVFEEIGVTAYQGAAPLLASKTNLINALGIHNVEAYHAGSIRLRIYQAGAGAQADSAALAAFLATADGTASSSAGPDDVGVNDPLGGGGSATAGSTLVDTTTGNSDRTFARTTSQVLTLAYVGGAAGTGGGFFPNGMNGVIR